MALAVFTIQVAYQRTSHFITLVDKPFKFVNFFWLIIG